MAGGGGISGCIEHGISEMGKKLDTSTTYRGSTTRFSFYQGFVNLAAPFVISNCCLVLMLGFLEVATQTSVAIIEVVPVAPTVVCVKVATHGAWSKNLWASSRIFAMFDVA